MTSSENVERNEKVDVPLRFSIASARQAYALGASIFVEVTIANQGAEPLLVRRYLLLPADDPRNTLYFEVTDEHGEKLERISHTLTGRMLVERWAMVETLEAGQTYTQTFQLAGRYGGRLDRKTAAGAVWSLGENPAIDTINDYPAQHRGRYSLRAVYHNAEDGSDWPEEFWDRRRKVWTGTLTSNVIEIDLLD